MRPKRKTCAIPNKITKDITDRYQRQFKIIDGHVDKIVWEKSQKYSRLHGLTSIGRIMNTRNGKDLVIKREEFPQDEINAWNDKDFAKFKY